MSPFCQEIVDIAKLCGKPAVVWYVSPSGWVHPRCSKHLDGSFKSETMVLNEEEAEIYRMHES